ncbi:hypothetical protein AAVH_01382 [Aphelenchoides avenae]|nr:hypothetical protein AAVH_01382 [Aphelenchus avenae]
MSSQPPPAIRRWPLQKYTQIAYRQTPEKSYVARTHGELSFELNLNSKTLVVKQGFCVTEEVALLADRLPDVYSKDTRLMFSLKEPFTNNTFRKFRVSFYSAADFQSFSDSLSHFLAIRTASKSSMSCVTPCFSAQKFPQPYDEVSTPVNSAISRNLLDGFAFPTPSYTQRTPQTQDSSSSTSQYAPYLRSGNSQQDTNSQLFENPQRYLSQQHTTSQPQFRPLLLESSPVSSQQRFPQEQMERGSAAQFYNPHSSQQDFVGPQFGAPAPTALSRTPSQHSSRLKARPNHISHEEPFVSPPTSNQQSQYSQWGSAMPHMIPSAQQSQEYPARDSASAWSFKTATNASSAYSVGAEAKHSTC